MPSESDPRLKEIVTQWSDLPEWAKEAMFAITKGGKHVEK
jgi:hypothetical protein